MTWPIPRGGTAILSTCPEALARAARSRHSDEHISIIQDTSLTRSSYEQSRARTSEAGRRACAHTNKPAARAREQRTRHGGAAHTARAAQLRGKHNTHCAHTPRSIHGARRARAPSTSFARASRAGINTTGHARGTHYQIHFKNTQVMEATLKCAVYTDYYYTDYMEIVRADPSCVTTMFLH